MVASTELVIKIQFVGQAPGGVIAAAAALCDHLSRKALEDGGQLPAKSVSMTWRDAEGNVADSGGLE